jgi:hypothetical protein
MGLDTHKKGYEFPPEEVALMVAMRHAMEGRTRPEAPKEDIVAAWDELGFRDQFSTSAAAMLKDLADANLIGDVRHSGKHWYHFLDNRSQFKDIHPETYRILSKEYHRRFMQAQKR